MAPKKAKAQTMSIGDFLSNPSLGPSSSWADEVEEYTSIGTQPLPPIDRARSSGPAWASGGGDRGYATRDRERDMFPTRLPDRPPYTAHLGNLSYDATVESVTEFFGDCAVTSVRIIEDREQQRPKGFAYAEFETLDGLKKALDMNGDPLEGRPMRIKIADPPRGGDRENRGDMARELSSWERKGPLPDMPSRNRDFADRRGPSDFGERRAAPDFGERRGPPPDFGDRRGPGEFSDRSDRRQSREPVDDGKFRDMNNWERKGPLSPVAAPPAMERQPSRDGSRSRAGDFGPRSESFRNNRKASPATWGEGRPQGEEGSRPPRREFVDRPERAPTAAEKDTQWRDRMRPDAPAKSPAQSREGTETPSSPVAGVASPVTSGPPTSRPRLNLAKRTVSEVPEVSTPTADAKASPFGAARPIDTAAREREVEDRRQQAIKEKREADEKAKEERRLAKEKEAAAKAESDAAAAPASASGEESTATITQESAAAQPAAAPAADKPVDAPAAEADKPAEAATTDAPTGEQRLPIRTKDDSPKAASRATDSGNWRSGGGDRARGGDRGRDSRGRGGSRGGTRGGRNYDVPRDARQNGSFSGREQRGDQRGDQPPATPTTPGPVGEDGWTTVSSKEKRRGQQSRA